MLKKTKLLLLFLCITILTYNCSSDDSETPKYLDHLIGSWSPAVGLMTGEIINGDYGEPSFTYNFGECERENGRLTFNTNGSLEFIRYKGRMDQGCTITESSKNVIWERVGDSTFIAEGVITQLNTQGTYDEKDMYDLAWEPYLPQPDLVKVKNDTLILFYDKIPNTRLHYTRFFYVKK